MWGENLHDLSITGPGLIWGKGLSAGHGNRPLPSGVGNKTITLKTAAMCSCEIFRLKKGGHFALLLTAVDVLKIDGLTLDTDRDGMDIDCCKNVHVSNCTVNSPEDDGICLKSSYGLGVCALVRQRDHHELLCDGAVRDRDADRWDREAGADGK